MMIEIKDKEGFMRNDGRKTKPVEFRLYRGGWLDLSRMPLDLLEESLALWYPGFKGIRVTALQSIWFEYY
jgi:hypothetical protein